MTPTHAPSTEHTPRGPDELLAAWNELQQSEPKLRVRAAADRLGVSEAELVHSAIGEGRVRPISAEINGFLHRIEPLGEVMALTRNDVFVHEKTGVYQNVSTGPHASQVVGHDIDLRIFQGAWKHGFAVESEARGRTLHSLQFFDASGTAVHKIFARPGTDLDSWEALVGDLRVPDPGPLGVETPEKASPKNERSDDQIDVGALEAGWREMRDTHDFFHLLRTESVGRVQALRVVSDELARRADGGALRHVLTGASTGEVPLMVFVRSPGTFQIHHGPVRKIADHEEWLNVLDPGFSLHVREGEIAQSWVVRKPTETGWVTSLELYDEHEGLLALVFGERGEGEPENPAWQALVNGC